MRDIAFEVACFESSLHSNNLKQNSFGFNNINEPISVLDKRSPSTSPSSSVSGGANGCTTTTPPPILPFSGDQKWPEFELQQPGFGYGYEDWENLLSQFPAQDHFLRWISGDFDDTCLGLQQLLQSNQFDQNAPPVTLSETPVATSSDHNRNINKDLVSVEGYQKAPVFHQSLQKSPVSDLGFEKDSILNQGFEKVEILNQDNELLYKKPLIATGIKQEPPQTSLSPPNNHHNHQQLICDQLSAAGELILGGNRSHAQGILARLNHQLVSASGSKNCFQRAAFCFKEAMQMQLQSQSDLNPIDGLLKMGAYKMFSEVSPIIQFMNFTANQTLLEALGDAKNIHIIDFDIAFGAQWASFIQELPARSNTSLKITAFASPSTHHPFELGLVHENLSHLAQEVGISFSLEVVNFDSFDPRWFSVSENETIAVNFPIWSACSHLSAIPSILHFVKQLSPRIVISLDHGCERTDLPFPHYLQQGLQYYEVLLDSIDSANVVSDVSNKIERYLFQSQVEQMVSGKLQFPEQMPHWKSLFAAGGYSRVCLSNFVLTQAECVLKQMQVQGFRVEKRQASLVLCWQDHVLMTASAWKC